MPQLICYVVSSSNNSLWYTQDPLPLVPYHSVVLFVRPHDKLHELKVKNNSRKKEKKKKERKGKKRCSKWFVPFSLHRKKTGIFRQCWIEVQLICLKLVQCYLTKLDRMQYRNAGIWGFREQHQIRKWWLSAAIESWGDTLFTL